MTPRTTAIRAQQRKVLAELGKVGPLVVGSLAEVGVKCGNPRCRCARGERHTAYVLTSKVRGKTKTIHVPRGMVEEVRQWTEEHRRLKELVRNLSALAEVLIRRYVGENRAARLGSRSRSPTRPKRT